MTNNTQLNNAINYFEKNYSTYFEKFEEFIRIPSISADSKYNPDVEKAAHWLAAYLTEMGMEKVTVYSTTKHPIVYGEYLKAGLDKPTILVYGHYDVQPPDPLNEWKSDPFEPTIDGDFLVGRGASDMKGQILAGLYAIDSILATGTLDVNLKFIYEGEEEIGSPSIVDFIKTHTDLLASDFALNLDAGMIGKDSPTIVYGLRGLAYFEIYVQGPDHDLHSGLFGGIVYNPAQALSELIAGMKDENGRITLPGFYDAVLPLDENERQELARLGLDDEFFKEQTGVEELSGEIGYTPVEQVGARPTLDVNGMSSGYTGEGPKTVIPSMAMAKISTRLVPNQTPAMVKEQLIQYMQEHAPSQIKWEVKQLSSDPASIADRSYYATQCFVDALREVWGTEPVYKREGGSIPIVSHMKDTLGIESVLSGFCLPGDLIHSPNEHIHIPTWKKGIHATIHFLYNLGTHND
ncbi:MAG TPA: dipeptidase [Anaerolineaceae bacterium]|uniref:Putative M20 family peptidase n=1 Tax=Anaerolinea thermophila TaxID=167964 RepID=A0A101FY14_9CHLR|nr:MAG: Putative M20 family peptidase [Anaerolinea thermophila]HAF61242.1 dipeptidase [Anaerolineaceae bacterium]